MMAALYPSLVYNAQADGRAADFRYIFRYNPFGFKAVDVIKTCIKIDFCASMPR